MQRAEQGSLRTLSNAHKTNFGLTTVNTNQISVPGNIDVLITTLNDYDISAADIRTSKNIDNILSCMDANNRNHVLSMKQLKNNPAS